MHASVDKIISILYVEKTRLNGLDISIFNDQLVGEVYSVYLKILFTYKYKPMIRQCNSARN